MSDRGGGVNHRPLRGRGRERRGGSVGRAVPESQDAEALCGEPRVAVPATGGTVAGTVGFDDQAAAGIRTPTLKGQTGHDGAGKDLEAMGVQVMPEIAFDRGHGATKAFGPGLPGDVLEAVRHLSGFSPPPRPSPCQGRVRKAVAPFKMKVAPRSPRTPCSRARTRPPRATSACGEAPSVPCRRSLPSG